MKQKQVHLGIRISQRERRWYQTAAKCRGLSLSDWARKVLLAAAFRYPAEDHPARQEIIEALKREMVKMTGSESLELDFALAEAARK